MNTTMAIRARRSIRKYKPNVEIPRQDIEQMLEAAMMAPSAANTRPWGFVVVKSRELRAEMAEALLYAQMLPDASLAVCVYARPDLLPQGLDGFWPQDCGAAIQNLLLQATELGYGAVWCGVYPVEERAAALREMLGIEGVPVAVIPIGVPDEQPQARGFYDPDRVKFL